MIEKNLRKIQDFEKNFDLLLKEFENFKNHFIQTLFNYCLTQKKLVNYLKNNFNKNNDNCNYQAFTNYEIFHNNNSLINEYIQKINYSFNRSFVEKGEIESNIKIFIKLIENFKSKKNFFLIKKEEIINKINEMEELALDDLQEVTSFTSFNNGKNIIFGLKKGTIKIYEFKKNLSNLELLNLRFEIAEFKNEINYLCDLDKNLFAALDEKNNIKIFEYKNSIQNYILIQNLESNSFNGKIYSMINLPILSQRNNKNYFCTSDNENISIYSADKPLKNKDNKFSIIKNIAINKKIYCMIEADENYLVAACSETKSIKFFDINDEFKEKSEIKDILAMAGNNTMTVIPNKKMLIVACANGFNIISIQNLKKYRFVHCRYKVLSLDMIIDDQVICCTKSESNYKYNDEIKLKHYKINEDDFTFAKIAERNINDDQEIWKLRAINKKIFYLKSNYKINGLA
jgi:WD40 repeat protein